LPPGGFVVVDSQGSVELSKDLNGEGWVTLADGSVHGIKVGGQVVREAAFAGWSMTAAETINGQNKVIWSFMDGSISEWNVDSNWNKIGDLVHAAGSPGLHSVEEDWRMDFNNDGIIGTPDPTPVPGLPGTPIPDPGISDLNSDGFVDGVINYQMWTSSGGVDLQSRRGKTYSDGSSRMWNAVKAVQQNGGFSVLVEGQQKKAGNFKVITASDEGVISGSTRWLTGNKMSIEGYEDVFFIDFNSNNQIGF